MPTSYGRGTDHHFHARASAVAVYMETRDQTRGDHRMRLTERGGRLGLRQSGGVAYHADEAGSGVRADDGHKIKSMIGRSTRTVDSEPKTSPELEKGRHGVDQC